MSAKQKPRSKPATDASRSGWELIWGKKGKNPPDLTPGNEKPGKSIPKVLNGRG